MTGHEPKADLASLAESLNSVAIHLLRRIRRADETLGVTPARLSALSVLVFGGPRSLAELAAAEQVTSPTMSGIVRGLEADGLVRREPDPDDARAIRLSATPEGRSLMLRGRDQRVARLVDDLSRLPDEDLDAIRRATEALRSIEDDGGV